MPPATCRSAGGRAAICDGRHRRVILVELPTSERAPLLKAFLRLARGARPHIRVDVDAPLAEYEQVADRCPVFLVTPAPEAART